MEQKNPIGWVEIAVTDLDRAEKFYKDFFGIECARQPETEGFTMSMFPMDEGYGASGSLVTGEGCVPSKEGTLVYFAAPEGGITAAIEKAKSLDIEVVMDYMDIGEFGHMAMIIDSEGNRIALHSENK